MPGAQRQQPGLVESPRREPSHPARVEDVGAGGVPRSLYLHLPFCVSKCPYCDFNSHVGQRHLFNGYLRALVEEVRAWGSELGHPELDTVFIGGGTPSLVPGGHIATLLDAVREAFTLAPGAEVSLEANPQSAEADRMEAWLEAGVNRLSLGVQSLDDPTLRFLERAHDAAEARAVIGRARGAGFASLSFDLMFAVPGLSTERWRAVLEEALSHGPDHLSAYELTPEAGTRLGADVLARRTILPDEDTQVEQYGVASELLAAAGFERYEVSNWARRGQQCRHNLAYWGGQPYAAAGAGAHAFAMPPAVPRWLDPRPTGAVTVRQWNVASPAAYIAAVRQRGSAVAGSEWLDLATTGSDLMMMGLRLEAGVDLARADLALPGVAALLEPAVARLVTEGLLHRSGQQVSATTRGRAVLNRVAAEFLP
ncbi:MAG: radical SAM family heme chaperone HemW [Candidatus Dormibacteraeota bacterium]|nr:radical SAM family heme chaperone HemW [Candidatus Dormibacteraeota bacterium]